MYLELEVPCDAQRIALRNTEAGVGVAAAPIAPAPGCACETAKSAATEFPLHSALKCFSFPNPADVQESTESNWASNLRMAFLIKSFSHAFKRGDRVSFVVLKTAQDI